MATMVTRAAAPRRERVLHWRSWRTAVSLTALAGGAAAVAGCLMPWATAFAGLLTIPGTRGSNGKVLAAVGVLIAAAGIWHLTRAGTASRWVIGVVGAAVLGDSAYLLLRLAGSLRSLGSDPMTMLRGGPGLWVVAAGGLAAFSTLFFPASSQAAFRAAGQPGAGLAAWAADRQAAGPRRWLQVALGAVWLLDAALQFQPYMFTSGFATRILGPSGMGSPAVISNSVMGTGQIMLAHPAIFNAGYATIQLAIGLGLLWRRTSRAALAATIVWALAVWWLGEGLGGLLTGSASPVTGAPGAALIYVVVAVLIWPPKAAAPAIERDPGARADAATSGGAAEGSVAAGSRLGRRGAQLIWAALWASFAYLVLQPSARAPGALGAALAAQAAGEPGWIAAMDRWAAGGSGSAGTVISVSLAVVFLVIAAGVLFPAATRPVLILALVTALAMWAVGQDFGGILTGHGTDPGTAPLLILLGAAFWPPGRTGWVTTPPSPLARLTPCPGPSASCSARPSPGS